MPVVKNKIEYSDLGTCVIGKRAHVFLRQHPTVKLPEGGTWVFTSAVLGFLKTGSNGPIFETMNSIYTPFTPESNGAFHQTMKDPEARKTSHARRTWGFVEQQS